MREGQDRAGAGIGSLQAELTILSCYFHKIHTLLTKDLQVLIVNECFVVRTNAISASVAWQCGGGRPGGRRRCGCATARPRRGAVAG